MNDSDRMPYQRADDSRSTADSTNRLLADWNIADDGFAIADRRRGSNGSRASGDSSSVTTFRRRELGQSLNFLADFELGASAADGGTPPESLAKIDPERAVGPRGPVPAKAGPSGVPSQRPKLALPHPGDELAGFRIIIELGRGAFARVFLAEEINLGRRLVAIKVSRPDGDEPRILARLQHAHIVPVHSVCDDPVSGLRVLCMPYFGGADLARVLRAAGGLVPTRHNGGSLVDALDRVSRKLPDSLAMPPTHRTVHPPRSSQPGPCSAPAAASLHVGSLARADHVPATTSRFRGFFFRLVGSPPAGHVPVADDDGPSRQFLRSATAIQAAVWLVARLAEGLEHAHARGLLHRDLKPSNILLAADGTPMLLDFNLAVERQVTSPEGEIRRALVGGTLPYMSPEHLEAFHPELTTSADNLDERSDIYALGLIFTELLTGELPFPDPPPGTPLLETLELMAACRRDPPSLRARCPQVPWSLDALAAHCLAFDPNRRYARAGDLAEDLRRFLDDLPMKHCPEPSVRERMGKWARRHPGLCGSTSIAVCAVVLLGLVLGTLGVVYETMQGLSARLRYRVFDQDFAEVQFLLNTAGGTNEHLKKGIDKAGATLGSVGAASDPLGRWSDWACRLAPEEVRRLREQVVEMIMLDARARVSLAIQSGDETARGRAIDHAIARLDHAERIDPSPPSALFAERARYHAAAGDFDRARRDRRRALAVPLSTCHDLTLHATSLLSAGDRLGAEKALKEALRLDGTSFWAWFVLGHCHFAQGRFLEAAGDFAACAVRGPKFAWVHFNRGLALARAGRPLEARYAYDQTLELDPSFAEALVNRALVELELDQLASAERDLVRAIELGRDDLVALTSLGETWARLGRRGDAERYFAGLLARDPGSIAVSVARGFTRIATDPAGARGDLEVALSRDPRHAHALYGMALLERGTDLHKALDCLDRALESNPNLIDAVQLRALVRARLGQPAALDDVERLLESPTPTHLYNAACAVAVYADRAQVPRLVSRAIDLVARAIDAGFPPSDAASDADLAPLRTSPRFQRLLARKGAG